GGVHDRVCTDRNAVCYPDVPKYHHTRPYEDIVPDHRAGIVAAALSGEVDTVVDPAVFPDPDTSIHNQGAHMGDGEPGPKDVGRDMKAEPSAETDMLQSQVKGIRPPEKRLPAIKVILQLPEQ